MIWLWAFTYLLAGATIGRMCYEFDVFAAEPPRTAMEQAAARLAADLIRRREIRMCWIAGCGWFVIPAIAVWVHVKNPRP